MPADRQVPQPRPLRRSKHGGEAVCDVGTPNGIAADPISCRFRKILNYIRSNTMEIDTIRAVDYLQGHFTLDGTAAKLCTAIFEY